MVGAVNPISVLVLGAFLGGLYWAIFFGPKYLDNLDVREAVEGAMAGWHGNDDAMVTQIITRMAKVGWHREEDPESGELIERPGLDLKPENITVEHDEGARTMNVTVRYTRDVHLVPFNKWTLMSFTVERGGPAIP